MRRRQLTRLAGIGLIVLLLAGCGREPLVRQQSYVFGTLVEISVYGEEEARAKAAIGEVLADFDRLHTDLHPWKPGLLSAVNRAFAAGPEPIAVPPAIARIVEDAKRLSLLSGDRFNPAIGRLVELWGFHADEFKPALPDPAAVARLVAANPRMEDVEVKGNTLASRNPAVQLDLGGFAKGYALDRAAEQLRRRGVKNALVNVGGNILALGSHGRRPWRVGIQHPRKPEPLATLELRDGEAIGTSGDYQRYFILDGKRYCHIIDPRAGRPVEGVQAVTVVAAPGPGAGALSDAGSKPPFVAGPGGWRAAAAGMGLAQVLFIDGGGRIFVTRALAERLQFTEKGIAVQVAP